MPRIWRKADVTPVFRKGKKEDPRNYRPGSLTSASGKMVEQLFQKTVSSHIKDKQIIRSSLYGVTKGKFCLMKLIHR